MATQPEIQPDTIEPGAPQELPPMPSDDPPPSAPDEAPTLPPDTDQPGRGPAEQPIPL